MYGGIDKMDSLIAMFQCQFKVRRWPMKVFFHLIDLTVCNAWLLYQLEHKKTYPGEKHLDLYAFKRYVSEVWMEKNQYSGYCRLSNTGSRLAAMVPRKLRFDGKKHWPHCFSGYNSRHRCQQCKLMTNMFCIKCKVHLCCHSKRNCFTRFHTEDQYRNRVINLPTLFYFR